MVRGADREQARTRMVQVLGQIQSVGVEINIALLRRLVTDQAFADADLDTGLIERRHSSLFPDRVPAPDTVMALAAATVLGKQGRVDSGHAAARIDPWSLADGWRISGTYTQTLHLIDNGQTRTLRLHRDADGWTCGESEHARSEEHTSELSH